MGFANSYYEKPISHIHKYLCKEAFLRHLTSQITDTNIKTALSDANAKYKILTAQRKAWDGGPEDSRRLYSLFDEKTGLFYVVEELL